MALRLVLNIVALTMLAAPAAAQVTPRSDLAGRLDALEAELRSLEAARSNTWLTTSRRAEIRGLVHEVLADADTRSSLLESGMTGGYDKGFFLASADGNFRLDVGGQIQVRYVYNRQDDGPGDANTLDASRGGFEVRRLKLTVDGHVFDPTWQYKASGSFSRTTGRFGSSDLIIAKVLDDGFKVRVGQFKAPLLREELMSSRRQLAADRSIVNDRWKQDRSLGLELSWQGDRVRVASMVHDGLGANLGFDLRSRQRPWDREGVEIALATRIEVLLVGGWKQFKSFSSPRGSETGVMIGAAFNYQRQEYGTTGAGTLFPQLPPGVDNEIEDLRLTADVSVVGDGWNAFAAVVWTDFDNDTSSADPAHIDTSPWGVVVQGGLFLTDDWDIFARYEFGDDDNGGAADLSVLTVGANRYFDGHALKWTTDVGYGFNPLESRWGPRTSLGWRADRAGEDGQVVVRTQFQLLF